MTSSASYSKRLHIHSVPFIVLAVGVTCTLLMSVASMQAGAGATALMFRPALWAAPVNSGAVVGDTQKVVLHTDPGGAAAAVQAARTLVLLQAIDDAAAAVPTVR